MSGICGCLLKKEYASIGSHVLDTMIPNIQGEDSSCYDKGVVSSAAVAACGYAGIYSDQGLMVAYSGSPRFVDSLSTKEKSGTHTAKDIGALYRKVGDKALDKLRGSFSLVIIDIALNKILLAIDRTGLCSLYYSVTDHGLAFSTSLDSIRKFPGINDSIDPQSIYDYLYFHMVPGPRSIYKGQYKLLPGQAVIYNGDTLNQYFYWEARYNDGGDVNVSALKQDFRRILKDAVGRCSDSNQTGAFLSGGTDSSTVAGTLSQIYDGQARTYSIGFDVPGFDETEYARIAANRFNTDHHEYYVTPQDVVDSIPLIARAYDEPFGNASAVPAYYCARMASDDGTEMLLAGDGGDELFGGNERYATQKLFEVYGYFPHWLRNGLIEPIANWFPLGDRITPVRKIKRYISQAKVPLPDRLESYNLLHQIKIDDVFESGFINEINQDEPLENLREVYNRTNSSSYLNRMLHLDMKITLADNDLPKVSRMCELAGVRVCYPLLDEEMIDFAAALPPGQKLKRLRLRHFFKESLNDFLPAEIIKKSKHGFGLPFGIWLKEYQPLRELAYDSLKSLQQRGFIKPGFIDMAIEQHRTEHATYYGTMIWVLMMLEQWFHEHGN